MRKIRKVMWAVLLGSAVILSQPRCPKAEIRTWTNLGLYGGQIYDIAIDPNNPDKMFAGIYCGDGLFVSTDGGNSWSAVELLNQLAGEDTFRNHAVWSTITGRK